MVALRSSVDEVTHSILHVHTGIFLAEDDEDYRGPYRTIILLLIGGVLGVFWRELFQLLTGLF
ncbi:hypothetical protein MMB232_02185 [Brevundimonas subvibrioides]